MGDSKQIRIYVLLTAIFMFMAIVVAFIPDKDVYTEINPESIVKELNQKASVSADELAKIIMSGDTRINIIDIRSEEEYNKFSLENAINLPINKLIEKNKRAKFVNSDIISPEFGKTILYSNGDVLSSQAWAILKRLNSKNIYFLDGGLNKWVETIMRPQAPDMSFATKKELEIYYLRRAASMYFGGGAAVESSTNQSSTPKKAVKKRKKAEEDEGGC